MMRTMMLTTIPYRPRLARFAMILVLVLLAVPGLAAAQESKPGSTEPSEPPADVLPPEWGTVEQIMMQSVRNIAARYNLNDEQTQITEDLMRERVTQFLEEHHDEIWPAIRTLIKAQLAGAPPENKAEVMRVGRVGRPLAQDALEAILEANEVWRECLAEDQRALHDWDLADIDRQFKEIDENLRSWAEGNPKDAGIFPVPQRYPGEPPRPIKPPDGWLPSKENRGKVQTTTAESREDIFSPDMFEAWVEAFIKDNELDAAQTGNARSILKEYKGRADAYLDANKEKISLAMVKQERALKLKDHEARKEADEEHRQLLEPVNDMFQQMEERLVAQLTTAQRARYEQNKAKGASKERVEKKDESGKSGEGKKQPPKRPSPKTQTAKAKKAKANRSPKDSKP
jgi:hypothetical protein